LPAKFFHPEVTHGQEWLVADKITPLKPERQAVQQSEERARQLVRNAPVAMIVSNRETQEIELANERFIRLFGYKLEDIPDVNQWWPVAYPDPAYRERVKTEWAVLLERVLDDPQRVERMEARVRCRDGISRDIEFHLSAFGDAYLVSFVDLTERKRSEQALRESEERLRLAAQAGRMYAFEWDAVTDKVAHSAESADVLGFSSQPGQGTGRAWFERICPQDRTSFVRLIGELHPDRATYQTSYRVMSPTGGFLWLEENGRALFDAQGKTVRVIGMVANVTERKAAEQALLESEERLRLASEAGRMYAYDWDPVTDVLVRTTECKKILGEDAALVTTLREVWSKFREADRQRITAAMSKLSPKNPTTRVSYRSTRSDGSEVWLEQSVRALFDSSGKWIRLIGMVVDITKRKEAEQALATVSGKLIEAQEQERRRIARDLHDDVNQRLALLNIELQQLADRPPDTQEELRKRADELCQRASEISSDVSALTRELYSPKLELLGIIPAMRGFCDELASHQKVTVDFRHGDIPNRLPRDVSLCLFRVLQEALRNAVKHSGVQRFEAQLQAAPGAIQLTIRDEGTGFEPDEVNRGSGLGMVSMRERVGLVGGTIVIVSKPNGGTQIAVRIPLQEVEG
jgi:PAS domain S-box-containing protein